MPDGHNFLCLRWHGGMAYIVVRFNNLMDYLQLLFAFFNAPLFDRALRFLGITLQHLGRGGALHALSFSLHSLPERHGGKLLTGHWGPFGLSLRNDCCHLLY